ncbi:glycosyl hydrolase family 28-related protein [Saccharophagus degradans]|nr:glycosyl hydrolase family 28-related protein [Saccharophagus degradans]MDO6607452.1 glycosyl hydrolase family 28-related protein [Saccharophagus degradans]
MHMFKRIKSVSSRGYPLKASVFTAVFLLSMCIHATESIDNINQKMPNFSYAGYKNGEHALRIPVKHRLNVVDFGAVANDGKDDTLAFRKTLAKADSLQGPVHISVPAGRFIFSDILYIQRSNIVLQGAGTAGTTLYMPRPLSFAPNPEALAELRTYLVTLNKRQREPHNLIDLPYSQYSWSGGYIWVGVAGDRIKPYLDKLDTPINPIAKPTAGKQGESVMVVDNPSALSAGQVITINWYNKAGENSALLASLYPGLSRDHIGENHRKFPNRPLVTQYSKVAKVEGNRVTLADVLLHDIEPNTDISITPFLTNVGIEELTIAFPDSPFVAHHVEQGFNGIYLTGLFDGWVKNITVINSDSAVLTEKIANVTIKGVTTTGTHKAHYSVAMSNTHNVLVDGLKVFNPVEHPISFNTGATKSVYTHSEIYSRPILDQHSGANHQNLFDNLQMYIELNEQELASNSYALFKTGGAKYWWPAHGAGSSFWNIQITFENGVSNISNTPIKLYGVKDGPGANLVGVKANTPVKIEYLPQPAILDAERDLTSVPSLYLYQLQKRLAKSEN